MNVIFRPVFRNNFSALYVGVCKRFMISYYSAQDCLFSVQQCSERMSFFTWAQIHLSAADLGSANFGEDRFFHISIELFAKLAFLCKFTALDFVELEKVGILQNFHVIHHFVSILLDFASLWMQNNARRQLSLSLSCIHKNQRFSVQHSICCHENIIAILKCAIIVRMNVNTLAICMAFFLFSMRKHRSE